MFLGNRGFTYTTRFAKTIEFACVFGVFRIIFKIRIFVKIMFCDLVFEWFLGNRGFTHATRFAKTIDFACVLVYFSEYPKSKFLKNECFVT